MCDARGVFSTHVTHCASFCRCCTTVCAPLLHAERFNSVALSNGSGMVCLCSELPMPSVPPLAALCQASPSPPPHTQARILLHQAECRVSFPALLPQLLLSVCVVEAVPVRPRFPACSQPASAVPKPPCGGHDCPGSQGSTHASVLPVVSLLHVCFNEAHV
jgi:hypothetical protein